MSEFRIFKVKILVAKSKFVQILGFLVLKIVKICYQVQRLFKFWFFKVKKSV